MLKTVNIAFYHNTGGFGIKITPRDKIMEGIMKESLEIAKETYMKVFELKDLNESDRDNISRIASSIFINKNNIRQRSNIKSDPNAPATDKQLGLLKKLGINTPKNINKREASKLIEESMKK